MDLSVLPLACLFGLHFQSLAFNVLRAFSLPSAGVWVVSIVLLHSSATLERRVGSHRFVVSVQPCLGMELLQDPRVKLLTDPSSYAANIVFQRCLCHGIPRRFDLCHPLLFDEATPHWWDSHVSLKSLYFLQGSRIVAQK